MSNRFEMADALVARAKLRRSEIGDHGDPYEEALISGVVGTELKIIIKEIFDHLRSALDYCAREICAVCTGGATISKPVYFPIVASGFPSHEFRSRIGKLMPNVLTGRPDLEPVLASFQPFHSPDNEWIADFATLCNENKHQNLTVVESGLLQGLFYKNVDGQVIIRATKPDGSSPRSLPMTLIRGLPESGLGACSIVYIRLTDIDEELLWFLDRCISGVEHICQELRSRV